MNNGSSQADRLEQASHSWFSNLAGRLAGQSASRPWWFLTCGLVALILSLLSISRLHIAASLTAMLGTDTASAAAMDRIARNFRASDGLLVFIELPPDHPGGDQGRRDLVTFSTQLTSSLLQDDRAAPLIEWVRSGEDPAVSQFIRDVVIPNGAFYLNDEVITELLHRIEPQAMQRQFSRNEAMVGTAGPAAVVLSTRVLQDPLRLFELIPGTALDSESRSGSLGGTAAFDDVHEHSEDKRAVLLRVGLSHLGSEYEAASPLVDIVQTVAEQLNDSDFRVRLGGFVPIASGSARVIRRDAIVSCVVALVMLLTLFRIFYRRWAAGLIIGGIAATGLLVGLGVAALFLQEISPLAAMISALLAGLGVDYGIHFLSHYQLCRAAEHDTVTRSVVAARHMASPLIATCGTTVLGFMSLWFSEIQMLSDFAILGAFGLLGSLCAVFLLMPAAIAVVKWSPATPDGIGTSLHDRDSWVIRHPIACVAAAGGVLAMLLIGASIRGFAIPLETDLRVMHPEPNIAMDTTAEIIRRFSGQGDFIPIEVQADSPHALMIAAHDAAAALTSPSCREVGIVQITGLHQLLPDPRRAEQTRRRFAEVDPAATMLAFWSVVDASVFSPKAYADYGNLLKQLITPTHAPSLVDVVSYEKISSRILPAEGSIDDELPTTTVLVAQLAEPIVDRSQRRQVVDTLNRAAASVEGGDVIVAGVAAVTLELEDTARRGLPRSAVISLVLVLGWLFMFLQSILRILMALLPLVFAAAAIVLFIMATGQRLNPINAVALPLLAGIAVDAGLFLLAASPVGIPRRTNETWHLRAASHAVVLSTTTTTVAFLAICLSHTPAIHSLGIVSAVGAMASGIGSLLLLMPLLVTWISPIRKQC